MITKLDLLAACRLGILKGGEKSLAEELAEADDREYFELAKLASDLENDGRWCREHGILREDYARLDLKTRMRILVNAFDYVNSLKMKAAK